MGVVQKGWLDYYSRFGSQFLRRFSARFLVIDTIVLTGFRISGDLGWGIVWLDASRRAHQISAMRSSGLQLHPIADVDPIVLWARQLPGTNG
jgi:hypothetical protein